VKALLGPLLEADIVEPRDDGRLELVDAGVHFASMEELTA
jgi:hypothetical protein